MSASVEHVHYPLNRICDFHGKTIIVQIKYVLALYADEQLVERMTYFEKTFN